MMARRVSTNQSKKSIGSLIKYILNEKNSGEKVAFSWKVNVKPIDLARLIKDIEATQLRSDSPNVQKNYHLVVSFQRLDSPSEGTIRKIDQDFAKGLGYEHHQRVVAVHCNTENLHFHSIINKVDPVTYRVIDPKDEREKLRTISNQCEINYQLIPSKKIDEMSFRDFRGYLYRKKIHGEKPNGAKRIEAYSWIQSFYSWFVIHGVPVLKQALDHRKPSWEQIHTKLNEINVRIERGGSGILFCHGSEKLYLKGSSLGEQFSLKSLESKVGPYVAQQSHLRQSKPVISYQRRPLVQGQLSDHLFNCYLKKKQSAGNLKRKLLTCLRAEHRRRVKSVNNFYSRKHSLIKRKILINREMVALEKHKEQKKRLIFLIDAQYRLQREKVRQAFGVLTWKEYLQREAAKGNNLAADLIDLIEEFRIRKKNRSRKHVVSLKRRSRTEDLESVMTDQSPIVRKRIQNSYIQEKNNVLILVGFNRGTIETMTRLAKSKYGKVLEVKGSENFKRIVLEVNQERSLNIRFTDPKMELDQQQLKKCARSERVLSHGTRF